VDARSVVNVNLPQSQVATSPLAQVLKSSIPFLLFYLIVPNLPVLLFERGMLLSPHGYINVECFLVGVLAILLPRSATFLLLSMEMVLSFVYLLCYTYQFSLGSLLASLHYLSLLPVGQIWLILAALAVVCMFAGIGAYWCPRPTGRSRIGVAASLLFAAIVFVTIDTVDGENPAWPRDVASAMPRLTLSPLVTLAQRERLFRFVETSSLNSGNTKMDSASEKATTFLDRGSTAKSPNFVLVVVESWGLLRDPQLAQTLVSNYQDPRVLEKFRVSSGAVPFDGLTVPGEARELCHSHMGFGVLNLGEAQRAGCLPAVFHAHGYQNIAVHGYVGQMFQRVSWYEAIGFDQTWFSPSLRQAGLADCDGAFPGICDTSISQWIGRALLSGDKDQPKFIYWVTLNSHLPVPEHPDLSGNNICSLRAELDHSKSLCSWFHLVSELHQSIHELALESQTRPTVFVLVGDHAPPFANPELRQMFSATEVPYVILTPTTI
jgi:phosphoglycerol transferase MdoB-like AlkP superfamily enzyme